MPTVRVFGSPAVSARINKHVGRVGRLEVDGDSEYL